MYYPLNWLKMALNIPTKKAGDQLTADEVNQMVSEVNRKEYSVPGKGLSANDFTNEEKSKLSGLQNYNDADIRKRITEVEGKVSDIVNNPPENSVLITNKEVKIGTFSLEGENHDLFEQSFKLYELPVTTGETREFIISEEPLGYGLYMSIEGFSVSSGKKMQSEFFMGAYEVQKIYVNSQMKTVVAIKCKETVGQALSAVLHLVYCKFFGDKLTLELTLPQGISPESVDLTFPKLKYNKKIIFSWINDDSYSIWNSIFCLVNKKWVDDGEMSFWDPSDTRSFFPHLNWTYNGVSKTTGYIPEHPLEYTDGARVRHRFATSVATWIDKLGGRDEDVGIFWPWNSAKETRVMADFGFTVDWHDLYNDGDVKNQENFNLRVSEKSKEFKSLIDRIPKTMVEPNGEHDYITFSMNNPVMQLIIAQTGDSRIKTVYPFKEGFTLNKNDVTVQRIFASGTNEEYIAGLMAKLRTAHNANDLSTIPWVIGSGHRSSQELDSTLLTGIYNEFGPDADDSVWVPSVDEFYEYWFMTSLATTVKEISGQKVKFTMFLPSSANFWFKSVSCLISGVSSMEGLSVVSSDNCKGESFALNDGKLLVNLDFDPGLISKVEKYVSMFESSQDSFSREDALYFVQLLKRALQAPYLARIFALSAPPVLSGMKINNGNPATQSRSVTVTYNSSGNPTHYMISESQDFAGAEWKAIVSEIPFMLSQTSGSKTVYLKVKNSFGESVVVSANITLEIVPFALNEISINNGNQNTTNRNVIVSMSLSGDIPTHYIISESLNFIGASWITFSGNTVDFELSSGLGAKTVYVKVKNATEESEVKSDSINLIEGASITGISINEGALETSVRTVSVAINTTGTPTHYRISENADFAGASWIPFVTPASFTLSEGLGSKTLYVQVKDSFTESNSVSGTITLIEAGTSGRTLVISFSGTNNPTYPVVNGKTINHTNAVRYIHAGKQLKDTDGNNWGTKVVDPDEYTTDDFSSSVNLNPQLSGDLGPYPDKYISAYIHAFKLNASVKYIIDPGTYKIRILTSCGPAAQNNGSYDDVSYYANDIMVHQSFDHVNNVDKFIEIDNVTVGSDGVLEIKTENKIAYRGGMNLIEIIKK